MTDDLISRHAVRLIESDSDAYPEVWNHDYERGFTDAIIRVIGLPSVNQWIPCSERLPDKDGIYLVTHRKFGKLEVTWNIFYGGEHASWLWNDEIIAWMPLPEPYKGEES